MAATARGANASIRTIGGAIGAAAMASIVTSGVARGGSPYEAGYEHGFEMLGVVAVVGAIAGLLVPVIRHGRSPGDHSPPELLHAELAIVPGGHARRWRVRVTLPGGPPPSRPARATRGAWL